MEAIQKVSRELTDEALMRALIDGEDSALAGLMSRWETVLKRYLYRLVLNAADAEDLAQETLVKVYQARHRFESGARFSPWIYAIATNLAKSRWRWRKVRRLVSLDTPDSHERPFERVDPRAEDGSTKIEIQERAAAVREAIAALPLDLRTVVILAEYEDQSHSEIAVTLGCSPKAVESRLYRARQKLRHALASWLPG